MKVSEPPSNLRGIPSESNKSELKCKLSSPPAPPKQILRGLNSPHIEPAPLFQVRKLHKAAPSPSSPPNPQEGIRSSEQPKGIPSAIEQELAQLQDC